MKPTKRDPETPDGRERLLTAARRLFTRRGAANVGINEVTDTAGVARMTLYNNFASKGALTAAVYAAMAEATLERIRAAGASARSERSRVLALFELFARDVGEPDHRGCPFIHAGLQAAEPDGEVHAIARTYKRALHADVVGRLDPARSDRTELADQIVMLLDGAVTEAWLGGVAHPMRSARRAAATLLGASRPANARPRS